MNNEDRWCLAKVNKHTGEMKVFCGDSWKTSGYRFDELFSPHFFSEAEIKNHIRYMASFFTESFLFAIPGWCLGEEFK